MAKTALLIGTSQYQSGFQALPVAAKDVVAMQAVLADEEIGQFEQIQTLIDPTHHEAVTALDKWFRSLQPDDLALLYVSGHGVKDDRRDLYFAVSDTQKDEESLIAPTAIPSRFIKDKLISSKASQQVVILDCCFSGAFGNFLVKDDGNVDLEEQLAVEGRVVLTSSSSVQYSFEQTGQDEKHQLSVYTRFLVEGLRTGIADSDEKGWITVGELHRFTSRKVQEVSPAMTPKIIVLKDEGFLIPIAKAPLGDPQLRYRRIVQELVQENAEVLDLTSTSAETAPLIDPDLDGPYLSEILQKLQISTEDAAQIEMEVLQPLEDLREKIKKYRTVFERAVKRQYPLAELQKRKLKRLQDELKLRDKDVQKIEAQVTALIQPIEPQSPPIVEKPEFEKAQAHHSEPQELKGKEDDLSSEVGIDYQNLQYFLQNSRWQEADHETLSIMSQVLKLTAGDLFSDDEIAEAILDFPCTDLQTIDKLWVKYSNGQFGFSVQKRIYLGVGARPSGDYPGDQVWQEFGKQVGWYVNGEWVNYPSVTFDQSAPQGHLPYIFNSNSAFAFGSTDMRHVGLTGFGFCGAIFARVAACRL